MRHAIVLPGLCLALAAAVRLDANQIVLPGSIQIAGTGRDNSAAAAFNTVNRTWLVVWRETDPSFASASIIQGRIVREDRTLLTAAFQVGYGNGAAPPRVAHDPIRNEWMVVWAGDCAIDTCPYFDIAQKVTSAESRGMNARRLVGKPVKRRLSTRIEERSWVGEGSFDCRVPHTTLESPSAKL